VRTASDPQGGGSYVVASEELGRLPGLMAAAGLLIDYVMTVAVSIASGVAAITSAYPSMQLATVWIGVGVIVILLTGNLRGVRQAGCVRRTDVRFRRSWPGIRG
jgi:amino acid transporter